MKDQLTKDDVVVVIFHDHGSRYVGKIYNDDWMKDRGFLERETSVRDIITGKGGYQFISVEKSHSIKEVLDIMRSNDISQLPIMESGNMIGSISEKNILNHILSNSNKLEEEVSTIKESPFPVVEMETSIKEVSRQLDRNIRAVMVTDNLGRPHIITQYDLIRAL
jgi:cystathionine beta-synthase